MAEEHDIACMCGDPLISKIRNLLDIREAVVLLLGKIEKWDLQNSGEWEDLAYRLYQLLGYGKNHKCAFLDENGKQRFLRKK